MKIRVYVACLSQPHAHPRQTEADLHQVHIYPPLTHSRFGSGYLRLLSFRYAQGPSPKCSGKVQSKKAPHQGSCSAGDLDVFRFMGKHRESAWLFGSRLY